LGGGRTKAESFLRHLEPLQGALEAYCRRSLRDPGVAGDVLQAAVANAYRDFHLFAEGTNFRAWIFHYVNGEVFNRNRKTARERHRALTAELHVEETWPMALDEPLAQVLRDDPEAVLDQCDQALAEAVRDLAPLERAVVLLRAIGEFKYREMSEILGVPVGTVMSSLSRGRLRLRQRLVDYGRERGLLKGTAADHDHE
jgi:RNA polymerase sigma-70 factor (ECF subfamily)